MDALASLSFLPLRFSKNAVAYTIEAYPDTLADRSDLRYNLHLLKPMAYGSGVFNELITLPGRELPKRSELGATYYPGAEFDISVFLDDFLNRTPPSSNQTSIVTCGDMITPYLVQTDISDEGGPIVTKNLPLEFAIKAGLGIEQFAGWRDQFFTRYLADSRSFLTWQPLEKWVDTVQPEFLYYLVNCTPKPVELRLRADVVYSDGSTESLGIQSLTSVSQCTVYSLPVSFSALGLPARETATGKLVHSYQVWVANESNQRLSQIRTYYVNREAEPNVLYLLFANSLGGYDTVRCTGQTSRLLTMKGMPAQRALAPNYLPSTAELFSLNRLGQKMLTVNTGWLDNDRLDYLSELVVSDEVYVVAKEGFVALVPSDTALALASDDEYIGGRTLVYQYAKNEVGFSNLPAPPTTPARATNWVPVNTFCLIDDNGLRTGYLSAAKLELHYVDDGSLVIPRRSKPNTPGTDGYVAPTKSGYCSTTPFVNSLVEKPGTYKRNNCPADQESTIAILRIAAGTYGAETADQLQARIDQALTVMDTQAYANANGSCLLNPAGYAYAVPTDNWHYRTNAPDRIGIETADAPYMGNAWTMQGRGGNYVYGTGTNDLNFPSPNFNAYEWRFFMYGKPYAKIRLRVYVNGVLYRDTASLSLNSDGYEYSGLFTKDDGTNLSIVSGDKIYIQLTDL